MACVYRLDVWPDSGSSLEQRVLNSDLSNLSHHLVMQGYLTSGKNITNPLPCTTCTPLPSIIVSIASVEEKVNLARPRYIKSS